MIHRSMLNGRTTTPPDHATFLNAGGSPVPQFPQKLLNSFAIRLHHSFIHLHILPSNNSYQFIIHAPNHNETTNSYMFGLSGHRPGSLRPPIGACICCSASWHYCRREPLAAADTIFFNSPPIDGGRGWDRNQGGGGQRRTYQERRARLSHLRSG